jgi:hypothetical protein
MIQLNLICLLFFFCSRIILYPWGVVTDFRLKVPVSTYMMSGMHFLQLKFGAETSAKPAGRANAGPSGLFLLMRKLQEKQKKLGPLCHARF